jgi:multiple antibiotic resistance protein
MDFGDIIKYFISFWAVIDPVGTIPVYIEATKYFDAETKKKIAIKAPLIAIIILLFFVVLGQIVLEGMHISMSAFQVSGGVVLFLFALTMVYGQSKPESEIHLIKDYKYVTVFPIAVPSIASPGAMMAAVLLTDNNLKTPFQQLLITLIMCSVLAIAMLLLLIASRVQKWIGDTGILVLSKIMGLILASIAVESVLAGLKAYFKIA